MTDRSNRYVVRCLAWMCLLPLLLALGCAAHLSQPVLHRHPPARRTLTAISVVERSGDDSWLRDPALLLGTGVASDLATARSLARAELDRSLARMIGIHVATEFSAEQQETDGATTFAAHQETRLASDRVEVSPDREYWERASDGTFRCWLGAAIDADTVVRLKRTKELERMLAGRKLVILEIAGEGAEALEAELARRLSIIDGIFAVPAAEASPEMGVRVEAEVDRRGATLRIAAVMKRVEASDPFELESALADAIGEVLRDAR